MKNSQADPHSLFKRTLAGSLLLHVVFFAALYFFTLIPDLTDKTNVEMQVVEISNPTAQALNALHAKPTPVTAARKVFGVSRKAITSSEGMAVKQGNTLATAPDHKILNAHDAESIPIPTEDYLVTQMPQLLNEVFVPYPANAKKRGAQGVVTLDLLIDSNGNVRKVELIEGPDPELSAAAVNAAPSFKFKPALVDDKPVAVRIRYAYKFVIRG